MTYRVVDSTEDASSEGTGEKYGISYELADVVKRWYYIIRILAIVGMMSVLVYIGIRILLSSTSSQKAKYKQLLGDWFIGMVLLFTMHFIMVFANIAVEHLTDIFSSINPMGQTALIPDDKDKVEDELREYDIEVVKEKTEVSADSKKVFKYEEGGSGNKYIEWNTDLMGQLRIALQAHKNDNEAYVGYTIMYITMVIYTCTFCFIYTRRVIYMAFLTIIAPLVALTYPIDKANDGSAQGFNYWFKEYIFNLLIQPLHLLLYTILVSSAIKFASENIIYALVALGFVVSAEKILRQMFNFSKASTPGVFAGPAGAALTMAGLRWLFGHGPRGGKGDGSQKGVGKGGVSGEDAEITSSGKNKYNVREGMSGLLGNGKKPGEGNPNPSNGGGASSGSGRTTRVLGTRSSEGGAPGGGSTPGGGDTPGGNSDYSLPSYWNESVLDQMPDNLTSEQEAEYLRNQGYDDEAIARLRESNPWDDTTYWNESTLDQTPDNLTSEQEEDEYLRSQGYDDEAIASLRESSSLDDTTTYWNDETSDFYTDGLDSYDDKAEMLRNLGYDETAIKEKLGKKEGRLRRAIGDTVGAFGDGMKQKLTRSLENAQPIEALGRLGMGAIGAAAAGTIGVAAGVAAGDVKNVAQYGAAGVAGGFKIGGGAYDTVSRAAHVDGLDETFARSYLGEKEYRDRIAKLNQKKAAEDEKNIRKVQQKLNMTRKQSKEWLNNNVSPMMENEVTDVSDMINIYKLQTNGPMIKDKNGQTRHYNLEEAIGAHKIYNRYNISGQTGKEGDVIGQIAKDYTHGNKEHAKILYNAAKSYDNVKNG